MWIKRNDCTLFFSLEEIYEIKIKKIFFKKKYKLFIKYKNGKEKSICKTNDINIAYQIFNLIMESIEKNNAITLEIPYDVKYIKK